MYMPVRRRMCSSDERVLILLSSYVALLLARPLVGVLAIASIRGLYVERAAIPGGGTRLADNGRLKMQESRSIKGGQEGETLSLVRLLI